MLSIIGESPINSTKSLLSVDAVIAQNILSETSSAIQIKGWNFNKETDYPLNTNSQTQEINLPKEIINVQIKGKDCTIRGCKLYDKENHTYKFQQQTITADITQILPFEDLPEAAKHYITIRAARIFQARVIGSGTLHGFSEEEEYKALVELKRADNRLTNPTLLGAKANLLHNWNPAKVLTR